MLQLSFRTLAHFALATAATVALTACGAKTTEVADEDAGVTAGGGTGVKDVVAAVDTGITGPGSGALGAKCKIDSDCESQICGDGKCSKSCSANADCDGGTECMTDNNFRAFCHKPTYPEGMGLACYLGAQCESGLECSHDDDSVYSVCTQECASNLDCPATMECQNMGPRSMCRPREFCSGCVTDEQCGEGAVCTDMGAGAKYCSRTCTPGKTECPRYADCTEIEGRNVCTHRSGLCVGDGTLCQPCADNLCATEDALCLTFPPTGESFCSQSCSTNADCGPSGYKCTKVSADGTKQCVPSVNRCVGKISKLYEVGDTMADYAVIGRRDTNGDGKLSDEEPQLIKLSDYADKDLIGITTSAGWCGPCQQEAKTFSATMKDPALKDRVMIFAVMIEDVAQPSKPTLDFALQWIKQFGVAGVNGIDPDRTPDQWNSQNAIPMNILIEGKTRKILAKGYGLTAPDGWTTEFKKFLK